MDLISGRSIRLTPVSLKLKCQIWQNFELVQTLMHILIPCKYQKNWTKTNEKSGDNIFLGLSLWRYFKSQKAHNSAAGGPI